MRQAWNWIGLAGAAVATWGPVPAADADAPPLGPPRPTTSVAVAADNGPAPSAKPPAVAVQPSAQRDAAPAGLSLLDCVAEALANNPEIGISRDAVLKAAGQRRTTSGALLPNLGFSYSETWQSEVKGISGGQPVIGQPGNTRTFSLTSGWVLYSGGALQASAAIARIADAAAKNQLRATVNTVLSKTVRAYLELLRAQELVGVADHTVELARQQVKVATDSFEAGAVPKVNVLRAQAALQNALQGQLRAGNGVDLAKASLNAVMGRSQLLPVQVRPLPRRLADAPPLLLSLQQAVKQRPELRAAQNSIEINQQAVRAASAGYLPSLAVNSRVSTTQGISSSGINDTFAVIGVLNLNLWDWYQTSGRVRQAKSDVAAARHQLELAMQNIELQVRQSVLNLTVAQKQVDVAQAEVDAARQALDIEQVRYTSGEGTYLELLDARRSASEAEANVVTSYYDNALAEADWLSATGGYVAGGEVTLPAGVKTTAPTVYKSQGKDYRELLKQYGVADQPAAGAPQQGPTPERQGGK